MGHTVQDLSISSVENSTIHALNDEGVEFRIHVDEASLARLKKTSSRSDVRLSPREIQTYLRSGLSVAEVAAMTGATLEHVERYAGPIVAERDYVITTAQSSSAFAHVASSEDTTTFGALIISRLEIAEARDSAWTAWKNDAGTWVIKLTFTVGAIERDARWEFDAKRTALTALNDEAVRLSSAGAFDVPVAPTLRAVDIAVEVTDLVDDTIIVEEVIVLDTEQLINVEPSAPDPEDVLAALRRRRRESEAAPAWLKEDVSSRTAPVEGLIEDSVDISLESFDTEDGVETPDSSAPSGPVYPTSTTGGHRRNRAAMPSWDEIMQDTHSDDDLI